MKIYLSITLILLCAGLGAAQELPEYIDPTPFMVIENTDPLPNYPGKAVVYVYADKTAETADTVKQPVLMDGQKLGNIRPARYFAVLVPEGTHAFHFKEQKKGRLETYFEAGKVYYLRADRDAGETTDSSKLTEIKPLAGALIIRQLKPIDASDVNSKTAVLNVSPEG